MNNGAVAQSGSAPGAPSARPRLADAERRQLGGRWFKSNLPRSTICERCNRPAWKLGYCRTCYAKMMWAFGLFLRFYLSSNAHADGERASRDTVRRDVGTYRGKDV